MEKKFHLNKFRALCSAQRNAQSYAQALAHKPCAQSFLCRMLSKHCCITIIPYHCITALLYCNTVLL